MDIKLNFFVQPRLSQKRNQCIVKELLKNLIIVKKIKQVIDNQTLASCEVPSGFEPL